MRRSGFYISFIAAADIFVFLYTAVHKLAEPNLFRLTIAKSALIGDLAGVLSWAIPVTEIGISVLLFLPACRNAGLAAATFLWFAFTIYVGWMLVFASRLPCSCGGIVSTMSWPQHLLFNLVFFTLNCIALYCYKRFVATNRISRTPV